MYFVEVVKVYPHLKKFLKRNLISNIFSHILLNWQPAFCELDPTFHPLKSTEVYNCLIITIIIIIIDTLCFKDNA